MTDRSKIEDQKTPRELLPVFYKQYNLDHDGGQRLPYVRIEFFKHFALYIPNFEVRKKAIFKHDVHHLATGYASTFKGETEISAWEMGSGIKKYWIAFLLDMQAVMIGILFNPRNVFRAYARGRRTKNLYADQLKDEDVMDMPLNLIREKLFLNTYTTKTTGSARDFLLFIGLLSIGLVYSLLSIVLLPLVIFYTIWVLLSRKTR